jgi:hypothetical protein
MGARTREVVVNQRLWANVRAIATCDERVDEVTRARVWARLERRFAEVPKVRLRWRRLSLAAALVAIAIAIAVRREAAHERALVAPEGVTIATALGPHTEATIVGPAELEIERTGDVTSVRLERGALYASFDGGVGRALRISVRDLFVDIVGTSFAIDARSAGVCVSVAHGRVRVTSTTGVIAVGGGERWCTGDAAIGPIDPAVRDLLARQDQRLARALPSPAAAAVAPVATVPPAVTVATGPSAPAPAAAPAPATIVPPAPPARLARLAAVSTGAPSQRPATPPPATTPRATSSVQAVRTDEALFREAESELGRRELAAADRALAQLLTDVPRSPLADQAMYERAWIAYQRHAWADARVHLAALCALPETPLAEPGRYLECRIAVESQQPDAVTCLERFRTSYPESAHDLDVIGLLVELRAASGGCAAARGTVDELVRRHPGSPLARAWAKRCPGSP